MTHSEHDTDQADVPIIIVGGGPVGLALAADLGWRGVRCLLVEQSDGEVLLPKTNGVNIRTMEFCRRWGLRDTIRNSGLPKDWPRDQVYLTSMMGAELARLKVPSIAADRPVRGAIETFMRIPQTAFDPILRDYVLDRPSVATRYQTRCEGFEEDAKGVTVTLTDLATDITEPVRCAYLVGCEGANSNIRDALGFKLEGRTLTYSTNAIFRSTDFLTLHDKGKGRAYNVISPDGPWAQIISINGKDLWGLHMHGSKDPSFNMSEDDIADALRRFMGCDFDFEIVSCVNWVRREMVADHYASRRVFLAGDAVHLLSPSGTLGMNTGNGDSTNLSWKFEAVLNGWAGDALLASYEAERRPIGQRNIVAATERFEAARLKGPGPLLLEDSPAGERVRAEVGAKLQKGDIYPPSEGFQIGYRYDDSPLCWPEDTPAPALSRTTYAPSTYPGARAPDAWLEDGSPLIDRFGACFVLVRLGAEPPDASALQTAADERGVPLDVLDIADPEIEELYEHRLVLVRPDGHVAWRGDDPPADATAIIDRARGAATPSDRANLAAE